MSEQLKVSEIFYSIQGESTYTGRPCVFIRLSGCNLRCNYCDAAYTWDDGEFQDIESILGQVDSFPCNLVELTGGEPLTQKNSRVLLQKLVEDGKEVLLESNGSIAIDSVPKGITVILDVKCPCSGSKESFHPDNLRFIKEKLKTEPDSCELKFVLSAREDYLWAKDFIETNGMNGVLPVLFSPVQERVSAQDLADWIMQDGLNVHLQLQLHTILWPGVDRGV